MECKRSEWVTEWKLKECVMLSSLSGEHTEWGWINETEWMYGTKSEMVHAEVVK